jgi:hypothetical protein
MCALGCNEICERSISFSSGMAGPKEKCRGRDSNPHGGCPPENFKSSAYATSPLVASKNSEAAGKSRVFRSAAVEWGGSILKVRAIRYLECTYILLTGLAGIRCRNRKGQRTSVEPAQEAFAFLSAQRFFIASDSLLLPAGVSRPRLFGVAVLGDNLFDRRFAQRRFIASDKRRRPSGVMLLRLLRAAFRVGPLLLKPAPSSRAAIARCIFSLSRFNSAMILSRSNMVLLD